MSLWAPTILHDIFFPSHRHFPVSGKLIRSYSIDGHLYTVNPLAINKNVNVYTENKREVYFIESPEFGKVGTKAVNQ